MNINIDSITGIPTDTYKYLNDFAINPVVLAIVTIVLILYYLLFASLGVTNGNIQNTITSKSILFLEILLWSLFVVLLLLNGIYYFFNINIIASIKDLFTDPDIKFDVQIENNGLTQLKTKEQTFHIPGNKYTYDDSKAICKAYGAKLATYKNLEDAYQKGADWCSYGWSEGQMAYFPTQYDKWNKLQKIKGHEHDCGRPGINGGYIENPNVRFGVNCYGYKPKISPLDYDLMYNTTIYPKTQKEIDFDRDVDQWKQKIPEIAIAPFNNDRWSVI
jgi:hypothetical protein